MCWQGQINPYQQNNSFSTLVPLKNSVNKNDEPPSDEDLRTGYKLFHAVVYCPPPSEIRLYSFVDHLLLTESPRTIIQTFVNLFRSGAVTDERSLALAKQFYYVLVSVFNLQYGNVLLTTTKKAQVKAMLENGWPFFGQNYEEVKRCFNTSSQCKGIQDSLLELGISTYYKICLMLKYQYFRC